MPEIGLEIRTFAPDDFDRVCEIFRHGITGGNATFQTGVKSWPDWDRAYLPDCRLVITDKGVVMGYAVLSAFSSVPAYRGVAEVSIYLDPSLQGRGAGKQLLRHLVRASERAGFWTLQAKIFPENQVSIALHEKCGFRIVGTFEKVGQLQDRWRDVVFMERRSKLVQL